MWNCRIAYAYGNETQQKHINYRVNIKRDGNGIKIHEKGGVKI